MTVRQEGFSTLLVAVILIAIIGLTTFTFTCIRSASQSSTISNKSVNYSLTVKNSKNTEVNGIQGRTAKDNHLSVTVYPTSNNQETKCTSKVPELSTVTRNNSHYELCGNTSLLLTSFKQDNSWHNVLFVAPDNSSLDVNEMQQIFSSIKVL